MIAIAQAKMPRANLVEWDISNGLPDEILAMKYDAIVSTYALHHLPDEAKITFIQQLLPLLATLAERFSSVISLFKHVRILKNAEKKAAGYWDDDEFYFVADEIHSALGDVCTAEFHPISHCGGVFIMTK